MNDSQVKRYRLKKLCFCSVVSFFLAGTATQGVNGIFVLLSHGRSSGAELLGIPFMYWVLPVAFVVCFLVLNHFLATKPRQSAANSEPANGPVTIDLNAESKIRGMQTCFWLIFGISGIGLTYGFISAGDAYGYNCILFNLTGIIYMGLLAFSIMILAHTHGVRKTVGKTYRNLAALPIAALGLVLLATMTVAVLRKIME